jgi:ribosome-binding factor A
MIQEISDIVRNELKDPRIGFVTVMDADVANNLRHANIYVSPMGTDEQKKGTIKGITSATPFIRRLLAQRMKMKFIPEIVFKWDHTLEYSDKINRLLHAIKKDEKVEPTQDSPDEKEE